MSQPPEAPRCTFRLPVFLPGIVIVGVLSLLCVWSPRLAEQLLGTAQAWISSHFGWFYTLSVACFIGVLLLIASSRFGRIRLGPDDARPEFGMRAWLAMLFAAGMGIGLMYFGVGEPMLHYLAPPTTDARSMASAREALEVTFFHWGLHAWSIYAVVGLVLAYFGFRYNLPLTVRSGLYPLLRERINGPIGHAVDVFALCCTIFGIATTLGFGVMQLSAGLEELLGWNTRTQAFQLGLIAVVISLAGISAATGVARGVRILSEINIGAAILLMCFVLATGPTVHLLSAFSENVGNYLFNLVPMTFRTFTYAPTHEASWFADWTLLYWAWWISWSPFVGMFIARISRGRTVREFIIGVLLVPTAFNLLWMTVFGNTAIWLDMGPAGGALGTAAGNIDGLLFAFLDYLPLSGITSGLAVLLISLFFITSADSGSMVVDNIASGGDERSPVWQRLFWAAVLGITAAALLAAGGLKALQTMTLIAALPFCAIMLLLCVGLWRGMSVDRLHFSQALAPATQFWRGDMWLRRLDQILHQPKAEDVARFIAGTVRPALDKVAAELQRRGVAATVAETADGAVQLDVPHDTLRSFVYGVRCATRAVPAFALHDASLPASSRPHTFLPETYFADGRQGYDVQYLTEQEMLADVLRQYERHLSLAMDPRTHLYASAPEHQPGNGPQ